MNIYISGSYKTKKKMLAPDPILHVHLFLVCFKMSMMQCTPTITVVQKKFFLQENLGFRTRRARHLSSARLHGTL